MGINSTVPPTKRRPGAFHEFKFVQSGQQLVPLDLRAVIVAEKTAAGTAVADVPIRVFDEDEADTKCGKGSLAALMVRKAIEQGKLSNGSPEIWVCPVAENGAGTAAIYTVTFTGPATEAGELTVTVCGLPITIGVSVGDSANTIAAAFKSKVDEYKSRLPVTASVLAAVVSLTFNTKGVNGNDVERTTVKFPAGTTVAHANPTPGAGATAITNALAALYDQRYYAIALANHAAADAAVILADAALAWGFGQKSYRFYFIGERGSLGTAETLQDSYNDYRVLISSCENCPSLPGEIAIAVAVAEFSRAAPNANLDGERLALYMPPAASAYTEPEVESALAGGVTPLTPDAPFVKIERLVTTQITMNSAPFEALRDIAYPRTSAYIAEQVDAGWLTGFKQQTYDADEETGTRPRVRDMVIEKHRAAEAEGYLKNVDSFLEQIQVELANAPTGRLVVSDPFSVADPIHQGAFVHTMYL
jgi:phage tail sheath gpL-like